MKVNLSQFFLPKLGSSKNDYEDAFAHKFQRNCNGESLTLALADGATESSFSAEWAKMFTRSFCKQPFNDLDGLKDRTQHLAIRWHNVINQVISRKSLSWYVEEKARLGAFCTLLGVQFIAIPTSAEHAGKFTAIAVGDTCLFQVRNQELIASFPISTAMSFGTSPTLISSNLKSNSPLWKNVKYYTERGCKVGDIFFLATDALACWFLSEYEQKKKPWEILARINEDPNRLKSFQEWADDARSSLQMKNDDITLLLVSL